MTEGLRRTTLGVTHSQGHLHVTQDEPKPLPRRLKPSFSSSRLFQRTAPYSLLWTQGILSLLLPLPRLAMPRNFFRRDSTTEETARRLAIQRRIEALVYHLDESVNWRHFVPGADRAWKGQYIWHEHDPHTVSVANAGIILSLEVANASVPVLGPPLLPTQGESITLNNADEWTYQDYGFSAQKKTRILRKTEWLLRDKRNPRNPPIFVVFRLLNPDNGFSTEPHPCSLRVAPKPPSYFNDHSQVERRDLSPTAPPYTETHSRSKANWNDEDKALFALRVKAFLGVHGRKVRFRGALTDDTPLRIEYSTDTHDAVTITNGGVWRAIIPFVPGRSNRVPLLTDLEKGVRVYAYVLPGTDRTGAGSLEVKYRGEGWDPRLSTLASDEWTYQFRSGHSHTNRPDALHQTTETDWIVTSQAGDRQPTAVRFVAPTNPFMPGERGEEGIRTAHVFSIRKPRL
ncbi:Salivary gland secretion 1 [Rhodotorula toruloides ATCC 204091]|nr:Salivary gland secretion 1 [Rhodotorula toruloides ATCC 204091]